MLPAKEPQFTAIGLSDVIEAPIKPSLLKLLGPSAAITKLSPAFKTMLEGVLPAAALLIKTTPGFTSAKEIVVLFSVARIEPNV